MPSRADGRLRQFAFRALGAAEAQPLGSHTKHLRTVNMAGSISSSKLRQIIKTEINDHELRQRFSKLGSPHLDTLIREAGVVLEDRLRSASGHTTLYGVELVDAALGTGDKALKFSLHPGEQEGARMLYRGAMQFIRNPPMHKLADYPLETARVFIRLIDSLLLLLPKSPSTQATITHRGRKKWSEKDFFGHLQQNVESNKVELVRELYDWSTKTADNVAFGVGQRDGSFSFQYNGKKKAITIFSILPI